LCSCPHRSPSSSSGVRGRAGRPVVPLGPAGRRLDRDRHDPVTYAVWLPEGLRRHAIDGRLLVDGGVVALVGANLADALVSCLGIFPVLGLMLAVVGAGLGARTTHRAVPDDPS
jgi:hypothetical protein